MLVVGLVFSIVYISIVPMYSSAVRSVHFVRSTAMVFLLCLIIGLPINFDSVELYHSVFYHSSINFIIDSLLYIIAILTLVGFHTRFNSHIIKLPEYSLILMFSILGATMIICANDLMSIYIALELQSFGLYLIACMRIDLTSSTHASLKYFLLGAISSAFILLGMSLIYQQVGTTNFDNLSAYIEAVQHKYSNTSVATDSFTNDSILMLLGLLSILCGCIFKISAAPFHSWFSDVIQGVPTYTSMVIINLPKISIFAFLFNFLHHTVNISDMSSGAAQIFILITTIFSLILGTVAGLMQTKIKRLLAFSTISHVGFLLISLVIGSEAETSLNALMFYITQYTLVTILAFLSLIAYENYVPNIDFAYNRSPSTINNIADFQGIGQYYRTLTFTFILCLFSMAGIPPLTGFYAKLEILNSSILTNHPILFITAIVCSVISAAYYLKVIKIVIFDQRIVFRAANIEFNSHSESASQINSNSGAFTQDISSLQSYIIAILTAFITLFILDPKLIINGTELVALAVYLT